jgi:hypothetical protein
MKPVFVSSSRSVLLCPAVAALLLLAATPSPAANTFWDVPATVSSEADVSIAGTLLEAVNLSSDGNGVPTTVTVNGVTFVGWAVNGGGISVSPGGHFSVEAALGHFKNSFNGFGSPGAPFSGLSPNYQTLLTSGMFPQSQIDGNDFTGGLKLTISGLTVGDTYQFQWWTNDSRPFATGPIFAMGGAISVSLDPNFTNAAGGVGQHVTGTFTADNSTQVIDFTTTGNGNVENAFQLRLVPEPSTALLLVCGCALLGTRRRNHGSPA